MSDRVIDIRERMKPPKTVGEFIERALADPQERKGIGAELTRLRGEQGPIYVSWRVDRNIGQVHLEIAPEQLACEVPIPTVGRVNRETDYMGPLDGLCKNCLREYAKEAK